MTDAPASADARYDDTAPFLRSGTAGEVIFHEGDTEADLFIVQAGRVELLRGDSICVGIAEEGDLVGEWSFFARQPRGLTARALTDFTLVRLDRAAFDHVVAQAPDAAIRMLHGLARALQGRRQEVLAASARAPAASPRAPRSTPTGPATLVETASGTAFPLDADESQVGRLDAASGFTPAIDLSPLDGERTLSRRHAVIVRHEGTYVVREPKPSRNGTFVNGMRVPPGVDVPLADGDEVRFGLVRTTFRWR